MRVHQGQKLYAAVTPTHTILSRGVAKTIFMQIELVMYLLAVYGSMWLLRDLCCYYGTVSHSFSRRLPCVALYGTDLHKGVTMALHT